MAIGPALPPHLTKRKRDSDSEDSDSGSEKRVKTVGPALPPTNAKNPDAIDLVDDSSDDDGPQPAMSIGPTLPGVPADEAPRARVIGPSMPPPDLQNHDADDDEGASRQNQSSSDDDDIGPALPPAEGTRRDIPGAGVTVRNAPKDVQTEPTLQRDDWMLAAPSGGDWTARVDPTKLRNRKFNTSTRPSGSSSVNAGSDMWSETPEQKRLRLQNQVLGVQEPGQNESKQAQRPTVSKDDEEKDRKIREFNEKNRGESLYSQHQGKRNKEEEDDPSKRAFDREKDIAGGSGLSFAKQREMMSKAADFGSRFAKGSYL